MTARRKKTEHEATRIDALCIPVTLCAKIGSIVVHADELLSPDGRQADEDALRPLLADEDVQLWLQRVASEWPGVLPRKRRNTTKRK